jgi:hypothetical protein
MKGRYSDSAILPFAARRDIVVLICIKVAALWLIYHVFFETHAPGPMPPHQVEQHLLGPGNP